MDLYYSLSLVATAVEMSVCLSCARQLWHLRNASKDRSRRYLAIGSAMSGLMAMGSLAITIALQSSAQQPTLLPGWIGWIFMVMNIVMTLYPITVVRPDWLTPRRHFYLFLPTLVLAIALAFFTGHWTPLFTPQDIWDNFLKPDVLLRLVCLLIMLPYIFLLFLLPYNYHHSSASFSWIVQYVAGLSILCFTHIVLMLTDYAPLFIVLPMLAAIFYFFSMEYELNDRLVPGPEDEDSPAEEAAPTAEHAEASAMDPVNSEHEQGLWPRICHLMDQKEVWRNPDLSLVSMARLCATNVTYLNRIIQQETGSGFKDLINTKRVNCVAQRLREQPDTDIQQAFFDAGYRSRTTAWRNFKNILGVSPQEYKSQVF